MTSEAHGSQGGVRPVAASKPIHRPDAAHSLAPGRRPTPRQDTPQSGFLQESTKRGLIFVASVALLNLALLAYAPAGLPPLRLFATSAFLWVATLPLLAVVGRVRRQVPLYPVISVLYFVYFGLPVFLDTVFVRYKTFEAPEVTYAVLLTLGGLLSMHLCFYGPIGKVVDLAPRLRFDIKLDQLVWFCILVGGGGSVIAGLFLSRAVLPSEALRAIANSVVRLPLILLTGVFLLFLRGRLTRLQNLLSAVIYAAYLLLALSSGALAQVLLAVAPFLFVYIAERGKLPLFPAALAVILLIPFNNSKHEFRRAVSRGGLDATERVSLFIELTVDKAVGARGVQPVGDISKASLDRTSYLGTFAYVLHETPSKIPYLNGATYEAMLWVFVPRVIAPDKPLNTLGTDFGHRYRLIGSEDRITSFNCPQLIELFLNFGPAGVLVGMGAIGLYYRLLYRVFNHGAGGDGMLLVAAATSAPLLNIESDAGLVLGGGVQMSIFAFVAIKGVIFLAERVFVSADGR